MNLTSLPVASSVASDMCSFYQGYYVAFQDMGIIVLKVGITLFIVDLIAGHITQAIKYYWEKYKRK